MDNNKVNIVNGAVVGIHLGTPMQDATPDRPEDNEAYATERNTETRLPNSNTEENLEKQPEPMGGGVSSWNDLTDKPFYKEQGEVVVLAEQTVVTEARGDIGMGNLVSNEAELFAGETYEVVFDGKTYICVAQTVQAFGDLVAVGNVGLSEQWVTSIGVEDTGEPFCFIVGNGWILATKTAGTYTISAKRMTETIKTIDPEFLPAGVGGGGMVVTFTMDSEGVVTADKTYQEIYDAYYTDGKQVYGVLPVDANDHTLANLSAINGDDAFFTGSTVTDEGLALFSLRLKRTGNGSVEFKQYLV